MSRRRAIKPSHAESIREELERLRLANGGELTAEAVKEAARNPESSLHSEFEWDDAKAAEQRRSDVARAILRRYGYPVRSTLTRTMLEAPYYVKNPLAEYDHAGYVASVEVAQMKDGPQALYRRELERVVAMIDRLESLAVTSGFSDIYSSEIAGHAEALRAALARSRGQEEAA